MLKDFRNPSKLSSTVPEMQTGTVTQQMVKVRYGGENFVSNSPKNVSDIALSLMRTFDLRISIYDIQH